MHSVVNLVLDSDMNLAMNLAVSSAVNPAMNTTMIVDVSLVPM
jgi:hypothetical protein